jgi:SAM-dependent methyltransferase
MRMKDAWLERSLVTTLSLVDDTPRSSARDSEETLDTRRYYDAHAGSYAEATQFSPLIEAFGPFAARLEPKAKILDLGCGAGRDLRAFAQRGFRAVGLDASLPLVGLAREFSRCPVLQGDLRWLPFEEGAFSGVWASASYLHLRREHIPAALREASRVLRPKGYLCTSVKTGIGEGADSRGRWFTYFRPDEWLGLLSDAGFTIVDAATTRQATGTLDKQMAVEWFACIAQKR